MASLPPLTENYINFDKSTVNGGLDNLKKINNSAYTGCPKLNVKQAPGERQG